MRVTLVGFPFSGKSTLFAAITGLPPEQLKPTDEALASVKVPDPRLDWLEALFKPRKRTEANIDFVDLPGGGDESDSAGLARQLPSLRQADALLMVVREFTSASVLPHQNRIDPKGDYRQLREEMLLADLLICDSRVEKLQKALTKPTKEKDQQKQELALLERCRDGLGAEKALSQVIQTADEAKLVRSFGFLTQKPVVVAINVDESRAGAAPSFQASDAAATITVCATIEAEIIAVDPADRAEFMAGWGIEALARDRIIRACFDGLGMISFLTCGEDEVRAWPVPRGASAVEAAGKIHSDLARGFIRAETIAYDDLRQAGSMRDAKAAGKVRQEPRGYPVKDGDILNIKFNV